MNTGILIYYEFRKYFTRFNILLLVILFILNLGATLFTYQEYFTDDYQVYLSKKDELIDLFLENPNEYNLLLNEHNDRVSKYNSELLSSRNAVPTFENHYINLKKYNDIDLFSDVEKSIRTHTTYKTRLAAILRDTIFRLEEADENTYIERYYLEFCQQYMSLIDIELPHTEVRGWNEFFSFRVPSMMLLIALSGTLCTIFTQDHRAGMSNIIYVSRYGGKPTIKAKLSFLLIMSAGITIIFSITPIFILAFSTGLSSLGHPIQTIDLLVDSPLEINIGQYLLIYFILRIIFFGAFTLLIAVITRFFDNEKFAFVTIAILVVSGIFFSKIQPASPYYFLQKFSITELSEIHILFEKYRGLNIFGYSINYSYFIIFSVIFLILLLGAFVLFHTTYNLHEYSESKYLSSKSEFSLSLFISELFKHLVCSKQLLLVLSVIILKGVFLYIYYCPNENYSEKQYKDYIQSISGEITQEKIDMITQEKQYIEKALADYPIAEIRYLSGEIDETTFNEYKKQNNYAEYYQYACKRLCERLDYLVEASQSHHNLEFIYDKGLELYFTSIIDIPLLLLIVFISCNIFSYEYEVGIDKIIRTLPKGRKSLFFTKLAYTLLFSFALYLIFNIMETGFIGYFYETNYWDVPIQSMPLFKSVNETQTIWEYMVKHQIISLLGYMACFILVFSFSAITKNHFKAIVITLFIVLIFFALEELSILPFPIANYIEMLSPLYIEQHNISYITCILASSISVTIAYKKWIGKKGHI